MIIPNWFLRELKAVDVNYKVSMDEESGVYDITNNGKVVDCFTILNDAALTELRCRKWVGKQIYTGYETKRQRAIKNQIWMKKERQRVAKKKSHLVDMLTENIMRIHRFETTKTFV